MDKHTQGPWDIIDINYHPYIEKEGFEICQFFRTAFLNDDYTEDLEFENAQANARLIAAAPELLRALEIAKTYMDDEEIGGENFDKDYSMILNAIKKAKGE